MPFGCIADDTTFAIDHTDLVTVDGAAPSDANARLYRAELATETAWTLKVAQCGGELHVTFVDDGTGLDTKDMYVVDAVREGSAIKGTIEIPLDDEARSLLGVSFHATAMR